jgi:hypothetical protein
MPFFKTTANVLKDNGEYFDPNWMDSDSLILPPKVDWDYQREMQIEDIDLWEVIYEEGSVGVYAAWTPYAEFYMFKPPWQMIEKGWGVETYYGTLAAERLTARLKEFNITLPTYKVWVEPKDMWLHVKGI